MDEGTVSACSGCSAASPVGGGVVNDDDGASVVGLVEGDGPIDMVRLSEALQDTPDKVLVVSATRLT